MALTTPTRPFGPRRFRHAGAIFAAVVLFAGCAGGGGTVPGIQQRSAQTGPSNGALSAADQARIAAVRARVAAKLANGYVLKFTGTATSAVMGDNRRPVFTVGPGHFMHVAVVPASEGGNLIAFDSAPSARSPQFDMNSCEECAPSGSPPPQAQPTPPPNFNDCFGRGGATWYSSSMGSGGCLTQQPGNTSIPLGCGTWQWVGGGRGRLTTTDGSVIGGLRWVSDNNDGSCDSG